MFQASNLSCYDKSQQAQGKLPICQYWHEEDKIANMIDIDYYNQNYLLSLMNGIDFLLRLYSKSENKETAVLFTFDKVRKLYQLNQLVGGSDGGGQDYSQEIDALENATSVLTTSVELSTEIGETTEVLLDELLTLGIDGRPDYKSSGATVYAENGAIGIIDSVNNSMQTASIKTVSVSAGGTDGDYLPLSGGTLTGVLNFDYNSGTYGNENLITFSAYNGSLNIIRTGQGGTGLVFDLVPSSGSTTRRFRLSTSGFYPDNTNGESQLGSGSNRWGTVFATHLSSTSGYGEPNKLIIPDKAGTLVVATPPTEDGSYVLKCVITNGVPTVSWVKE